MQNFRVLTLKKRREVLRLSVLILTSVNQFMAVSDVLPARHAHVRSSTHHNLWRGGQKERACSTLCIPGHPPREASLRVSAAGAHFLFSRARCTMLYRHAMHADFTAQLIVAQVCGHQRTSCSRVWDKAGTYSGGVWGRMDCFRVDPHQQLACFGSSCDEKIYMKSDGWDVGSNLGENTRSGIFSRIMPNLGE